MLISFPTLAQHSVARIWNEALLQAIRDDFARPTVHARNLFHTSVAMYDCWAVYDTIAETYFLGKTVNNYYCPFTPFDLPNDIESAREEAISYATYRLLSYRFANSPGATSSLARFDSIMDSLGYDKSIITLDYTSPAGLGNYIATFLINYGLQDYANEQNDYINTFYQPVNPTLLPVVPGNPDILDPNRWQPLSLKVFIDQSGKVLPLGTPEFQSPEWGKVLPFSLKEEDLDILVRDSNDYYTFHDPGPPPMIDTNSISASSELYMWNFSLVSKWGSHLDASDTLRWDISPASIGNIDSFPKEFADYPMFYKEYEGGDIGKGHDENPTTGQPYQPQIVKRADYARVLAEFWADGPDSETPPGHWFTILNYVSDHPLCEKKFKGERVKLGDLEWDVKAYFTLGGAMHDAAVSAWGIKGYYDYIRPISAIRFMADLGQSSDTSLSNYNVAGIPLDSGYVEIVSPTDPLAGSSGQHVGKIKVYSWRGPDYIQNPATDEAGAGWILAENWWPYQRPTFVTPPFAGYVSGHSTYSRAAAEVLSLFTGDDFFPGGMGEFFAKKDAFLVFEKGPSENITLQWATYRDASDQCSLSRIWGGIHPPADDIHGRMIGEKVGQDAFYFAEEYFGTKYLSVVDESKPSVFRLFPNPVSSNVLNVQIEGRQEGSKIEVLDLQGRILLQEEKTDQNEVIELDISGLSKGSYVLILESSGHIYSEFFIRN